MSDFKFAEVFKKLLAEARELNISGAELGRAVGVSKETISQYCKGGIIPRADKFMKIAEYFDVSPEYLLTGVDPFDKQEHHELKLSGAVIHYLKSCDDKEIAFIDQLLNHEIFSILVKAAAKNIEAGEVNAKDVIDGAMYGLARAALPEFIRAFDKFMLENYKFKRPLFKGTLLDEPEDGKSESSDN